jgi:hypothetical protein
MNDPEGNLVASPDIEVRLSLENVRNRFRPTTSSSNGKGGNTESTVFRIRIIQIR